jgi:hypothetical protein
VLKLLLILLSLQFATANAFLAEAGKLSFVWQHFQEHRAEAADITFLQFLCLHYADSQHEHADSQHKSLPLHGESGSAGFVFALFHPANSEWAPFSSGCLSDVKQAFHYRFCPPQGAFAAIFQPPRLA